MGQNLASQARPDRYQPPHSIHSIAPNTVVRITQCLEHVGKGLGRIVGGSLHQLTYRFQCSSPNSYLLIFQSLKNM